MSEFHPGDRVKDISGLLDAPAFATVREVKPADNADYEGAPEYLVKVRYDRDEDNGDQYEGSWWPDTDFRHISPSEDPRAEQIALAEVVAIKEDVAAQRVWPRKALLDEATALVTGDRNAQYGDPLQDFKRSAALLNALGYKNILNGGVRDITGHDIALIVAAVKMSRIAWAPWKRDSWVDLAGYAACGWENVEGQMNEEGL